MHWFAQAPSNIALIKYMGKKDENSNVPDNSSLSYTLNHLLSSVKLELVPGRKDLWEPLSIPGAPEFSLSIEGQRRYIEHLNRAKDFFGYTGGFLIQSSNNFPHSSGLASSASSFAALTKCACLALSELTNREQPTIDEQAQLSRLGSGSSCRSFYAPWSLWRQDNTVSAVDLPYKTLIHQVVVISSKEKNTLSRTAHHLVKTSPFYEGRGQRAKENLRLLLNALEEQDWPNVFHVCWREFQDMHQLFNTCEKPFSYMTDATNQLLTAIQKFWEKTGDGPVVTMDAGPNIHLLYRPEQTDLSRQFKIDYLLGNYDVL
ncbi:diphosphomevalonate/mevalonate 3,5-bisphosphate decarboxylase family protein [Legionella waltersii]|uniref:Mevalonate diphosphate decarboxylase n=1 Tax=Legionella waltersii TaxID=66969 RepID=A0A0W1APC6_9GAMM|nr:diphosphomevalonate decarboxylase [Legionella waltersii]KTD83091.1 mevalonate diphosphate decarboxylase [Legionella waltersii]SNV08034.1 mevalonate diphosphate decarboxylase [Legionella waltersii]